MKLQEEPAPIQALLEKRGLSTPTKIVLAVSGLLVLGVAIWLVFSAASASEDNATVQLAPEPTSNAGETVVFDGKVLERSLLDGQKIQFPLGTSTPEAVLRYQGDKVVLELAGEPLTLETGKIAIIDLNNDKQPDIRLLVRSVDSRSSPAKIIVRLDRDVTLNTILDTTASSPTVEDPISPNQSTPLINGAVVPPGMTAIASRQRGPVALFEAQQIGPFNASIRFSGSTFFRFHTDLGRKEERFAQASEVVNLTAGTFCRIWISNGARAKLLLNGKEFSLGGVGEIVAWQIAWVANPAGGQTLQLQAMY
jgi:hypothetical protein